MNQLGLRKLCIQRFNKVLKEEHLQLDKLCGEVTDDMDSGSESDMKSPDIIDVEFRINQVFDWPSKENPTSTCRQLGVTYIIDGGTETPLEINEEIYDLACNIIEAKTLQNYLLKSQVLNETTMEWYKEGKTDGN